MPEKLYWKVRYQINGKILVLYKDIYSEFIKSQASKRKDGV